MCFWICPHLVWDMFGNVSNIFPWLCHCLQREMPLQLDLGGDKTNKNILFHLFSNNKFLPFTFIFKVINILPHPFLRWCLNLCQGCVTKCLQSLIQQTVPRSIWNTHGPVLISIFNYSPGCISRMKQDFKLSVTLIQCLSGLNILVYSNSLFKLETA